MLRCGALCTTPASRAWEAVFLYAYPTSSFYYAISSKTVMMIASTNGTLKLNVRPNRIANNQMVRIQARLLLVKFMGISFLEIYQTGQNVSLVVLI